MDAKTTSSRTNGPKQVAIDLARHMLDEAVLPPGSKPYRGPLPVVLRSPADRPGIINLVQAHRVWVVPGTLPDVAGFLGANVPRGFSGGGNGRVSIGAEVSEFVDDQLSARPPDVSNADLEIKAANDGKGNVLMRGDSQVGWTLPRPARDFATAHDVVVTVSVVHVFHKGEPVGERVVATDAKLVQPIVRAFNRMRVAAPQQVYHCPEMSLHTVSYRVAFSSSTSARPDVVASIGKCGLGIDRRGGPQLTDSDGSFSNAVARVLGFSEPHLG